MKPSITSGIGRKMLATLLAFALMLGMIPAIAPMTAYAAGANDLKTTIESYTGGTGASGSPLTATVSGNTVTVTGNITNASQTLTLNIDEGVTVDWQASLESTADFSPQIPETPTDFRPLIMLEGAGSLTVSGNGKIAAHSAVAIRTSSDATVAITVEGSGRVTTTGESSPYETTIQFYRTIETHGNVTVKDSAFLSTDRSTVIYAQGEASQVTISGGTLQNNATHYSNPVVRTLGESSKVTVCGTGEVHAYTQNGYAVSAKGDVEVSGSAKISAVAGGSAVSVSGNGSEVSVYGGTITGVGSAIDGGISSATVVTIDGGSVTSTGSRAIRISSSPGSSATISGGTVGNGTADGNSTSPAISAHTINVSGGTVYGYTTSSFGVIFGTNVNISGTAKVQAKVDGAPAIYGGFVAITGGEVSATTGGAVYNSSDGGHVNVSGGTVFSYADKLVCGTDAKDGVINFYWYFYNESSFTGTAGTGMVIGWNKAAGNTSYTAGTSDDIVNSPDTATAVWGKSGDENGIFYTNGSNTGFIPLGVTVTGSDITAPALSAGTAARTGETQASIGFTTDEAGTAYYKVAEKNAAAPIFSASDWTSLGAVSGAVTDKSVTLTAGAKDIYVVVEDIWGNASNPLKIAVGAIYPKNPVPTMEVYVWGYKDFRGDDIVGGATDIDISGIITEPNPDIVVARLQSEALKGSIRLSGFAMGETNIVVNVAGMNITVPISVVEPPEGLKPVLSADTASRTSDTEATLGFTTSKAGNVYYLVKVAGEAAPVIPDDFLSFESGVPVEAGPVSLPVALTAGAKDVYVLLGEETYGLASNLLKIEVPAYDAVAALTGTPMIDNTAPKIGDTLTATLDGGNNTGTLSYAWKADGATVGTDSNTYTVATSDLGKEITVIITSSVERGSLESAMTSAVTKKDAPAAPAAPTLESKTHSSVTLTANAAYEFSVGGTDWQTDNVFTGLAANTPYTFYQRVAATADTPASAVSPGLPVTTDDAPAKSVTVGAQVGTLTAGTPGNAIFEVATANITSGSAIALNNTNDVLGITLGTPTTTGSTTSVVISIDSTTPNGSHSLTLTVDGVTSDSFDLAVGSAPPVVYAIALDVTGTYTFPSALEGYGEQTGKPVAVSNTGNQATGPLTISLSDSGADSFILSKTSIADIVTNGGDSFTVTPKDGLATGTYTATVTVSGGNGISQNFGVSFTVNPATPSGIAPAITTTTLPNGTVETAYSQTLAATGDTPITWTLDSGSLPDGLTLDGATGVISGTPTAAGIFDFTVKASNGTGSVTKQLSITIAPAAGATTYLLAVQSGTGGGNYTAGAQVTISADAAPSGKVFDKWTGGNDSMFASGSRTSATTTITMPGNAATVTATYKDGGDSNPNPDPTPGYSQRTLTDSSGVLVSGQMTANAALTVKENALHAKDTCAACDAIRKKQAAGELIVLYDISITSGQYTGSLEVSIPVDTKYNGDTVTIYHCAGGKLEKVDAVVTSGIAKGTFTSLSPFAVVKGKTDAKPSPNIPQTGDDSNMMGWMGVLLLSVLGVLCALVWRKWRQAKGIW